MTPTIGTPEEIELIARLNRSAEEANFLVGSVVQLCASRGIAVEGKPHLQDGGVSEIAIDILEAATALQSRIEEVERLEERIRELELLTCHSRAEPVARLRPSDECQG